MSGPDAFADTSARLRRAPVRGLDAMVVSGHPLASLAGLDALRNGGSVADAVVAASAVLCAVIPHATSLGGDAFVLYRDAAAGRTYGLNGSGPAPMAARPDAFGGAIAPRGARAASVPGIVRTWSALHQRFGRLAWRDLFVDAVRAARGHPASRLLSSGAGAHAAALRADPGCAAAFLPGGSPPREGERIAWPALVETLDAIATGGADAFHLGPIAQSITRAAAAHGGLLAADDLAAFEPEWVQPLSTRYRGFDVEVMPPNSYGLLMLLQLAALDGLDPAELRGRDEARLALLIRAAHAALAAARDRIADPRFTAVPVERLLADDSIAALRAAMRATPTHAGTQPAGGTSCVVAADGAGNGACVVQSVFHPFGCAVLDPGTGVLLNNRMTGFTLTPGSPNRVAPGKRPAHTLNPVLVRDGARFTHALATPGGPSQTLTLVQLLVNLLDHGQELAEAVEAPRWGLDLDGNTLLEDGHRAGVREALAQLGIATGNASGALYFGSVKLIARDRDGVLSGFADHRREAYAIGC